MSNWLNGSIDAQFRTIDGLSIRFAESADRALIEFNRRRSQEWQRGVGNEDHGGR